MRITTSYFGGVLQLACSKSNDAIYIILILLKLANYPSLQTSNHFLVREYFPQLQNLLWFHRIINLFFTKSMKLSSTFMNTNPTLVYDRANTMSRIKQIMVGLSDSRKWVSKSSSNFLLEVFLASWNYLFPSVVDCMNFSFALGLLIYLLYLYTILQTTTFVV